MLAAEQFYQYIAEQSQHHPVGNGVGEDHHNDGDKSR